MLLCSGWLLQVAAGTAENRSSMLQDFVAGRPTELPFLNGFVVDQGHENQVSCLGVV